MSVRLWHVSILHLLSLSIKHFRFVHHLEFPIQITLTSNLSRFLTFFFTSFRQQVFFNYSIICGKTSSTRKNLNNVESVAVLNDCSCQKLHIETRCSRRGGDSDKIGRFKRDLRILTYWVVISRIRNLRTWQFQVRCKAGLSLVLTFQIYAVEYF